ncbi:MAG: DUF6755 family protein [Vicinamibacterales bacterium]
MSVSTRRSITREQRTTIIYGMLIVVLIVVVLQLWLLTATMNAWLGGDDSIVWPAAAASAACLALNLGLLSYLIRLDRTRSGTG